MSLPPVAVIGMHRSGTSCLAGCLEDLGLSLGDVVTSAPHNKKGNRENPRFWPVHDAVLARVGASWDNPPSEPVAWTVQERADLKAVLADYDVLARPWGFKDPRATVLLDGWLEVLPDLRLVGSIRHPVAVAASLTARNGYEQSRGFAIWAGYNRALLRWRDLMAFDVIDFDAPDYEVRVRNAAHRLGLDAARHMPFRDTELNHQKAGSETPAEVADLWMQLSEAAR
ncbi:MULTISPECIES: sulfotransferase family protein [unclassified Brevundimonas]|uniref:sulfotransferase n=1 Tax=unclassified Brevundimonas TaxID=2622653 RepID=UPI000CFD3EAD|nr:MULTISPECIES: sulfotransferase family protein [unclassified Brevundimonas]PRA24708.1 sulfotransferase family protein [Brevundimonas sp. MYb27]PQZ74307.1 sulfotransferase family protein [Brevundimonas sp. MYb31]PRB10870.1 sulfotransferase family protein [Brevundimonas sp. MYb52]PRB32428.1 sulfotransferase family protein [Brevundimonas sp. MYb46]PRB44158.1 sulfotransferase family protein [Brevundimonas sp. MYb33]